MTLPLNGGFSSRPGVAVVVRCWHVAMTREGAEMRHACFRCCYSSLQPRYMPIDMILGNTADTGEKPVRLG